jgi:ribosome maturation factor RimP
VGWGQPIFFWKTVGMLTTETWQKIENLAIQVATREGCKLYDMDFSGGNSGRTLRVYIDKEGGASLDDCANVSRGLNLLLDVEDPIPGGAYHLEVSTPGVERPLRKPWHFSEAVGEKVWVRLKQTLESLGLQNKRLASQKQLSEVLSTVDNDGIYFEIESEKILIPFPIIEKARVVFEFDAEKGRKK